MHLFIWLFILVPFGLIDYAQETSQRGCDGQPIECIVLLASSWKILWEFHYRSNFLLLDHQYMEEYLQAGCYLQTSLSIYLDDESIWILIGPVKTFTKRKYDLYM